MRLKKIVWKIIFCFLLLGVMLSCGGSSGSGGGSSSSGDGSTTSDYEASPFAIHEVRFNDPSGGEVKAINDLNVKAARIAPYGSLIWDAIEKERGIYDWPYSDETISTGHNEGIKIFATVSAQRQQGPAKFPDDLYWFLEFLEKAIERYDGDGIDDAPGSPKIDVIQIGNEADGFFWEDTPENYALLLKEAYKAVKKADPDMKVAIAGVATPPGFYRFYQPVLEELGRIKDRPGDQYFDVFDFHWSGQFPGDNDYAVITNQHEMGEFISDIKNELSKIGYQNIDFYITEMSDYSGSPAGYSYHTETYHAAQIIKRYVYSLSRGIDKIFWAGIVEQHNFGGEENGYFDNVALINNPQNDGNSHKKLAYYTYKLMVEKIEGSDWGNVRIIQESDGVYIYKFNNNGKNIRVAWSDNNNSQSVSLSSLGVAGSVKVTEAVPNATDGSLIDENDYPNFFETETKPLTNGQVTITLGESPVFVEAIQ